MIIAIVITNKVESKLLLLSKHYSVRQGTLRLSEVSVMMSLHLMLG